MVERICANCQAGNPLDSEVCEGCGAKLDKPLAIRSATALIQRPALLPERWQRAGKAIAIGAVALAVEAGAAWLKQRADKQPAPLARRPVEQRHPGRSTVVARQRVWERYDGGHLTHRVVEQTVWQMPESAD